MRIAIIDDERIWIRKARECIELFYLDSRVEIDEYESGQSLIDANIEYDIIFVDVEMPDKDGFDTAIEYKAIYTDTVIVILTTHTEMSRKGYLVNAFRYIDKIEMESEINEALSAIEVLFQQEESICVKQIGVGNIRIVLKDLMYIETCKRNLILHTKSNEYICRCTMAQMEKRLQGKGFSRCHNSYIVNLDAIKKIEQCTLYMYNGDKIFVSKRKISELKKEYADRKCKTANS